MSGDPLLRFTRDAEQCLEVIRTERGTVAPFARSSLYDLQDSLRDPWFLIRYNATA